MRLKIATLGILVLSSKHIAAQETYTVLVQDYRALPPYSAYENGEYTGFNRELLDMFADQRGYCFEYLALPVRRLFVEFVAGIGDLKYPDNPNWAGQIKGDIPITYSAPVVKYINGVMVAPERYGEDINQVKALGLVAGWTPVGYQDRIENGQVELMENNSYEGLLRQAILGRIDGAYSNISTSRHYLENSIGSPDALVFDDTLPHVRSTGVLSSIKHPELIAEFDRFLAENAEQIQALRTRFDVEIGVGLQ